MDRLALAIVAALLVAFGASLHDASSNCTADRSALLADGALRDVARAGRGDDRMAHVPPAPDACVPGDDAADCADGTSSALRWRDAIAAALVERTGGYADWRVPGPGDLRSDVASCGGDPASGGGQGVEDLVGRLTAGARGEAAGAEPRSGMFPAAPMWGPTF